jgi:hypothetical protein
MKKVEVILQQEAKTPEGKKYKEEEHIGTYSINVSHYGSNIGKSYIEKKKGYLEE